MSEVVERAADAAALEKPPLLVVENVEAFLDEHALGRGPLRISRIGRGDGSNVAFLIERDQARYVLRRPPRPPLPPSAHDMVREARLQRALAELGIRVPAIVAVCEDDSVLGVPFYVMDFLEGHVADQVLPPGLESEAQRRKLGLELVDRLGEIHAVDVDTPALSSFVRPGSYLERQVRRWSQLWLLNRTRELPAMQEVERALSRELPEPLRPTVVHGDYRLGNMMLGARDPSEIIAVLDWEMGAIGDPRADVGYLLATYNEPGAPPNAIGLTGVTAMPGFPSKLELVQRYVEATGRDVEPIAWFEALALWKTAVFCEAIYGRFIRGELSGNLSWAATLETGVPAMAAAALELLG